MVKRIIGTIAGLFLLAIIPLIAHADSNVITGFSDSSFMTIHPGAVWISRTKAYVFSATASNALKYVKTTDGGASWSAPVQIDDPTPPSGYRINGFDVWYAGWSTGGSQYIHITWRYFTTGSPQSHLSYNRLDTNTDTFLRASDPHTTADIFTSNSDNAASSCTWAVRCVSIVRDAAGSLFIKNMMTTGGFMRSTDTGVSWATRTNTTDSPPWVMAPSPTNALIIAVGGTAASYKIQQYDELTNTWSVIKTVTPARNPAYDYKAWATAPGANETWVGLANGTTYRIFQITWNGTALVVTEKTAVSGYSANVNDIDLAWDETNLTLYAFYNDGGGIKYQRSTDLAVTWEAEETVTTTNVKSVRVAPLFRGDANRLMPIFFNNPNWARNINILILKVVTEPEDIDNWLIHFLGVFNLEDSNGRTFGAFGILLAIGIGLFLMKIHYLIIATIAVIFTAGLSQVRIPDGSKLIEPWIILVILLIAGVGIAIKILTSSGSGETVEN